jgi:hypothetical protein
MRSVAPRPASTKFSQGLVSPEYLLIGQEELSERQKHPHNAPALLMTNYDAVTSDASVIDAGCL